MLRVLFCMLIIGLLEMWMKDKWKENEGNTFEIAMSILMGAWIVSGANLIW